MSSNQPTRGRLATCLLALVVVAALTAAIAAPASAASAASAAGNAVIVGAEHSKGRTLSGQGVKLLAGDGGSTESNEVTLPIAAVNLGDRPSASSPATLTFKKGGRSVVVTGVRLELGAGTIAGKLLGVETSIFRVEGNPQVNVDSGAVALSGGKLRLLGVVAKTLRDELGLKRALNPKGVGTVWLAARANPAYAPLQTIVSGNVNWGFLASWRGYVLFADPPKFGTITLSEGATPTGSPMSPATTWNFPLGGGSFERGLYGSGGRLSVNAGGAVHFAKPGHCIMEIKLANPRIVLDGTASSLVVDLSYDIDKSTGPGCEDLGAPVSAPNTTFATLDPGAVTPSWSADGKTVTWSKVPAALTAAGRVPFGSFYKVGQELEAITITATVG